MCLFIAGNKVLPYHVRLGPHEQCLSTFMQSADCFKHQQIVELMPVFGHNTKNRVAISSADMNIKGIPSPS